MNQNNTNNPIEETNDSPCIKCLQKAQQAHIACYVAAGDDTAKKEACDKALEKAKKLCPCP